ncbi:MAG: sodium:solute symporter [Acholeplasmatales bacterium]|nr:sodium:solute symporter [Acholeplasmatales bacterium]
MDLFIKILFIVLFFAVTIFIGFYCRKKATNSNDFVLGGRNVGPWLSAFAYGTSYFSAVIFIGYAGSFGWAFGVSAFWIGVGNAVVGSWLAWALLGRKTRIMTQHLNSSTMPDFFGKRFNSKGLKIFASIIVFIFLIPYTAALYNGLSYLFNVTFSASVPYWVWILIISIATGAYVIVGGLMSTAINSFIQGLIMLVGIALVVIFALNKNGGLMGSFEALATGANGGWQFASLFGPDPVHLIFVVLLTSLGCWGLPQMVGKFYSIKNENQIRKGSVISTLFAIIVAGGCYFLGGFGRIFANEKSATIIPDMVASLNVVVVAIVIVLVLAASMSTLSGLVHTSAATVTFDLIDINKKLPEKKKMTWLRVLVVVFIIVSAGLAIFQVYGPQALTKDIASLMGISWGAISGAFIGPFFYGLYWKKTTKASVYASFISGILISVVSLVLSLAGVNAKIQGEHYLWFDFADSIYMGVLAMVVSFIIVPIVSKFTKAPLNANEIFACYEKMVVVTSDVALTDDQSELVDEYKETLSIKNKASDKVVFENSSDETTIDAKEEINV